MSYPLRIPRQPMFFAFRRPASDRGLTLAGRVLSSSQIAQFFDPNFVYFALLHFSHTGVIIVSEREVMIMTTKCFILNWADTSVCAIDRIEAEFPCFTWIHEIDEDSYEVSIQARDEDWPAIERILAPFV